MLWRVLQLGVFIGVAGWIAQEKLTPNGHLIALTAIAAAFAVTWMFSAIIDLVRRGLLLLKTQRRSARQQGLSHGSAHVNGRRRN